MQVFVSYNQNDCAPAYGHSGPHMLDFFDDLQRELREGCGETIPLLYRDLTHIPLGAVWSKELGSALQSCSLMISMCSPSYAKSRSCFKEFRAIENRLFHFNKFASASSVKPRGIIPIVWIKPDVQFPAEIRSKQLVNSKFPETYLKHGLRDLYQLGTHKDDRILTVKAIAAEIHEALKVPLPEDPKEFNWHGEHGIWSSVVKPTADQAQSTKVGQIRVRVTFVAGQDCELSAVRRSLDAYGPSSEDWHPFSEDSLEVDVQASAHERKLVTSNLPLDDGFRDYVDRSLERKEIIVVLVDPWSLRLDRYRGLCAQKVDTAVFPNGSMIAIENKDDPETISEEKNLRSALMIAFPRKSRDSSPHVVLSGIYDKGLFRQTLDKHLENAKNYVIGTAEVANPARDAQLRAQAPIPVDTRPELQGPGALGR